MSERRCVFHQLNAGCRGEGLARQIVRRRAQPAGGHDNVRPINRVAERGHIVFQVVAHRRMKRDRNAQLAQPLAEPLAIRVEPLAARELVANRNDFSGHRFCHSEVRRGI